MLDPDKQKTAALPKKDATVDNSVGPQQEEKNPPNDKSFVTIPAPQVFMDGDLFYRSRMPRHPDWSVVWSDLMMTMFIFFVVAYAYAITQKEFLGPPAPDTSITQATESDLGKATGASEGFIEKMFDLSRQALSDKSMQEFASVELVPEKTVRIILTGDLLFDSGQALLRPTAQESLAKIAALLRKTPYAINVIGHTDDRPIATLQFPSNWELSAARASAVARYLIDSQKIPASQFYITGYGFYKPVRPNDTPQNRAANRRVELIITREKPEASSLPLTKQPGNREGIGIP